MLLEKIKSRLIEKIVSQFNRKAYWNYRAKGFRSEYSGIQSKYGPQHDFLRKTLEEKKPKSILEIGCGFGRNLKFVADEIKGSKVEIVGSDFSDQMLLDAKQYLSNTGSAINLIKAEAKNLPFPDKSFDLVIIHGVLMHVAPKDLEKSFSEAVRVCRETIFLFEEHHLTPNLKQINEYTFNHDYQSLIKSRGLNAIQLRPYESGLLNIISVNSDR